MSNQNFKQHFRRMNLDSDVRSMKPGDYRKLTNGSPIPPATTSYANAAHDIVCNLIGNQLISNTLPGGTNQIIGFVEDKKSNRAFFCAWNSTAANNSIYMYQNGFVQLVMRTALFLWAQSDFVDMDVVGDILIFTNNRSDIQKINVAKAIAGGTYTPDGGELTLIKPPPTATVAITLAYDNTVNTNFIYGNYFQFFARFVYEDYDYSVFGPSSLVTNGWLHPSGTDVYYMSDINVNVGAGGLLTIDGMVTGDSERVLLIGQTVATENGIWLPHVGAWTRAADFAAASNSDVTVYVRGGSTKFGGVWRINSTNVGTVAATVTKLDGPNYLTITRGFSIPATVIQIEYAVRVNGSNEFIVYKTEKTGSFSSSHTFYNNTYLFTVPDSDTFVWNDNVPLTTKSLKIFKNRVFLFNNTEGFSYTSTTSVTLSLTDVTPSITTPTSGFPLTNTKAIRCAKNGGRYRVGIVWSDFAGRTFGVRNDAVITIPDGFIKRYKIHVDLTTVLATDTPPGATHRRIVCTKELNTSFFLSQTTQDIFYYKVDSAGTYTYGKDLTTFAAQGTLIDIGALAKENRGYTFQPGDRIKLLSGDSYNIIDVEILGQLGRFVMTRVLDNLYPPISTVAGTNLKFEIYTPKKADQGIFYETGFTEVNGAAFDLDGDIEIGNHSEKSASGGYSDTNPDSNTYIALPALQLEDMSVWDKNFPQWVTSAGRPMIKTDTRQINKYTYLRWSQLYILNANFLGINTFYALDEQALPIENGPGTRLAEAGEVLVAVHEVETEAVYVGQGFIQTSNQNSSLFLTKTENVVGDARKYLGGHGSIHPASVIARNGNVYFINSRKGVAIRRSQDGLTIISDEGLRGLISTMCNTDGLLIIAGWDPQYDCYCLTPLTQLQLPNTGFVRSLLPWLQHTNPSFQQPWAWVSDGVIKSDGSVPSFRDSSYLYATRPDGNPLGWSIGNYTWHFTGRNDAIGVDAGTLYCQVWGSNDGGVTVTSLGTYLNISSGAFAFDISFTTAQAWQDIVFSFSIGAPGNVTRTTINSSSFTLAPVSPTLGVTLYFHEKSKSWIFQNSLLPEFFGILGQKQLTFSNGGLWEQTPEANYNKFFGVQYNRQLDMEFNPLGSLMCIWDGIEIDAESIYSTGGSNEIVVQLYHKNGDTLQTQINVLDFIFRESDRVWRSVFYRWMQDQNFPGDTIKSKYFSNRRVRGQSAFMTIVYNGTDRNPMKSVTIYYTPSMQSNP